MGATAKSLMQVQWRFDAVTRFILLLLSIRLNLNPMSQSSIFSISDSAQVNRLHASGEASHHPPGTFFSSLSMIYRYSCPTLDTSITCPVTPLAFILTLLYSSINAFILPKCSYETWFSVLSIKYPSCPCTFIFQCQVPCIWEHFFPSKLYTIFTALLMPNCFAISYRSRSGASREYPTLKNPVRVLCLASKSTRHPFAAWFCKACSLLFVVAFCGC